MKITFLVPPVLDGSKQPAERTAGCTRVVYLAPNIYELTVVAVLEEEGHHDIAYRDFVYDRESREAFTKFLAEDTSDIYFIWTVNLSIENDLIATSLIHEHRPAAKVVLLGPGPTHFTQKCLTSDHDIVVRGEPEVTVRELVRAIEQGDDWQSVTGTSCLVDGKVRNNGFRPLLRDLDELPFAARHFIAHRRYYNPKLKTGPYTTLVTSRNCPYHCIYCVP
ncbi:MAG: radical SAM protein, partial [Muribaculaceae bacterium]|nr:radical SAM protein [Muribaculaceae bacterium]